MPPSLDRQWTVTKPSLNLALMPPQLLIEILPKADSPGLAPWIAFAVGVAAVAFVYYRSHKLARTRKDPLAKPPVMGSLAQQRSVERQMQGLLVELSEMARQIGAQLDTRAGKLDVLLREADDKLTQLQVASDALATARARVTEARLAVASHVAGASAPPASAHAAKSPPRPDSPIEAPIELPIELPLETLAPSSADQPPVTDTPLTEPLAESLAQAEPAAAEEPMELPPVAVATAHQPAVNQVPAQPLAVQAAEVAVAIAQAAPVAAPLAGPVHVTAIPVRSAAASSSSHAPYHPVILPSAAMIDTAGPAEADRFGPPIEMPLEMPLEIPRQNGAAHAESQDTTPPPHQAPPPQAPPPLTPITTPAPISPISAIDAGLANVAALSPEAFGAFDPGEPSPQPARQGFFSKQPAPAQSAPQPLSMGGFSKLPIANGSDVAQREDTNPPPPRPDTANFGLGPRGADAARFGPSAADAARFGPSAADAARFGPSAADAARFGTAKWPKAASASPPSPPPPMRAPPAMESSWPGSELLLPTSAPLPPDPRHVAVYQLADQGLTINAIAQQVDRPMGEIELILALRPRQERLA
jgi:hypothetical protein